MAYLHTHFTDDMCAVGKVPFGIDIRCQDRTKALPDTLSFVQESFLSSNLFFICKFRTKLNNILGAGPDN